MRVVELAELALETMTGPAGSAIASRSRYMTHWMGGSRSSASVYFELDPGAAFGRHYHSSEETILVLEGEVEVTVGEETRRLGPRSLVVAPALVRHNISNVGEEIARCVGFWSSASVVSIWDEKLEPLGSRRAGTPIPEGV